MPRNRTLLLHPAFWITLACALYGIWVIRAFDNPLALATLGSRFAPAELQPYTYSEEGYDGQFTYYFARYGLDAAEYIDNPAYRAQRMLFSTLARVLSFGQIAPLPYVLFAINCLMLALSLWALVTLLTEANAPRWSAIGYGLSLGVFGAARLLTHETLAYGLVIVALLLFHRQKVWLAALTFALALLGKETTIFFPAAFGVYLLYQRRIPQALSFGAIVLTPFLLYQAYLVQQLGAVGLDSGGGGATGFTPIPFGAVLQLGQMLQQPDIDTSAVTAIIGIALLFAIIPTLWAFWRVIHDLRYTVSDQPHSRLNSFSLWTWLLFANALIMPFVPASTYREPLGILRFIVGLQISIILYAAFHRQRRALLYSSLWAITSLLVIVTDLTLAGAI